MGDCPGEIGTICLGEKIGPRSDYHRRNKKEEGTKRCLKKGDAEWGWKGVSHEGGLQKKICKNPHLAGENSTNGERGMKGGKGKRRWGERQKRGAEKSGGKGGSKRKGQGMGSNTTFKEKKSRGTMPVKPKNQEGLNQSTEKPSLN